MTNASTGLGKALARANGGTVQTLSEMSASDIMANLSDEQKAELSASLPAPAAAAADGDKAMPPKKDGGESEASKDGDEDDKTGDSDMKDDAAKAAASDRVKAVATAVANDDACKGKADLALQMLADDDFSTLSASGIVKLLGKQPSPSAAASDDEAGAREEMKAALKASANSAVAANGGGGKPGASQANSANIWDAAINTVAPSTNAAI